MATVLRSTDPMAAVIADAHNDLKAQIGAGSHFHLDASEATVTAANATDLASSLTLVNNILGVYQFHMADTLAHKTTGVALASYAFATDLASAIARANDIQTKYNTHRASTTYHYNADATNVSSAAAASDQGTLNTLLNDLKTQLNAHMDGPTAKSLRLVGA